MLDKGQTDNDDGHVDVSRRTVVEGSGRGKKVVYWAGWRRAENSAALDPRDWVKNWEAQACEAHFPGAKISNRSRNVEMPVRLTKWS